MTMFLIVPVLIMVGGSLGVIPLTGVVTPFLSYGGSAMLANFAGLGVLAAIRAADKETRRLVTEPFVSSTRFLEAGLSVAALALIAVLLKVQVSPPMITWFARI